MSVDIGSEGTFYHLPLAQVAGANVAIEQNSSKQDT